MESDFSFDGVTSYNGGITIRDVQNTCIEAIDNQGMISYLLIYTDTGLTITVESGPLVPDSTELPDSASVVITQYEASEYKSKKQIAKFLQPKDKGKRRPVEVKEVDSGVAITETRMAFDVNLLRLCNVFSTGEVIDKEVTEDEDISTEE